MTEDPAQMQKRLDDLEEGIVAARHQAEEHGTLPDPHHHHATFIDPDGDGDPDDDPGIIGGL